MIFSVRGSVNCLKRNAGGPILMDLKESGPSSVAGTVLQRVAELGRKKSAETLVFFQRMGFSGRKYGDFHPRNGFEWQFFFGKGRRLRFHHWLRAGFEKILYIRSI